MIAVRGTDGQGASILIGEVCLHGVGRAAAAVQAAFRGRLRTAHRPLRLASSIGSVKTNRLLRPLSLSTQIRPPCSSTRRFESASPSPVPSEAVALALGALERDPARFAPMCEAFRRAVELQIEATRTRRNPRHRPRTHG